MRASAHASPSRIAKELRADDKPVSAIPEEAEKEKALRRWTRLGDRFEAFLDYANWQAMKDVVLAAGAFAVSVASAVATVGIASAMFVGVPSFLIGLGAGMAAGFLIYGVDKVRSAFGKG